MHIKGSIEIEKPREEVVRYFKDPQYLGEYQDGFVKKDLLSGRVGQEGSVSKMYYESGKRKMELTETILDNRLPDYFESHYHHKHMDNFMRCTFIPLDKDKTRYEYEFEYTRINWVMPRLMAILFPGVYRKQGEKWMRQFKEFVEKQ
jgi:hypothetical protein